MWKCIHACSIFGFRFRNGRVLLVFSFPKRSTRMRDKKAAVPRKQTGKGTVWGYRSAQPFFLNTLRIVPFSFLCRGVFLICWSFLLCWYMLKWVSTLNQRPLWNKHDQSNMRRSTKTISRWNDTKSGWQKVAAKTCYYNPVRCLWQKLNVSLCDGAIQNHFVTSFWRPSTSRRICLWQSCVLRQHSELPSMCATHTFNTLFHDCRKCVSEMDKPSGASVPESCNPMYSYIYIYVYIYIYIYIYVLLSTQLY